MKTEWDMEYRIWDIDRADEDEGRLEAIGSCLGVSYGGNVSALKIPYMT